MGWLCRVRCILFALAVMLAGGNARADTGLDLQPEQAIVPLAASTRYFHDLGAAADLNAARIALGDEFRRADGIGDGCAGDGGMEDVGAVEHGEGREVPAEGPAADSHATGVDIVGVRRGHGLERRDLVLHQRDQRRDDHRDAMACPLARNGRDLVTQRFAPARGHEHQRITPGRHMVNDGLLRAAKGIVAKNFAQDGQVG